MKKWDFFIEFTYIYPNQFITMKRIGLGFMITLAFSFWSCKEANDSTLDCSKSTSNSDEKPLVILGYEIGTTKDTTTEVICE